MEPELKPAGTCTGVDDVLITAELGRRSTRAPDYEAENRALGLLAQEMATNPGGVLRTCAELVMELCQADSAGISILEPGGESGLFRWHAAAGVFAANLHGTIPGEAGPCGTVIARNRVLLFNEAERFFPALRDIEPRVHENLLALSLVTSLHLEADQVFPGYGEVMLQFQDIGSERHGFPSEFRRSVIKELRRRMNSYGTGILASREAISNVCAQCGRVFGNAHLYTDHTGESLFSFPARMDGGPPKGLSPRLDRFFCRWWLDESLSQSPGPRLTTIAPSGPALNTTHRGGAPLPQGQLPA